MGRNKADFISSRHPDYKFTLLDNTAVEDTKGVPQPGHSLNVWHTPTNQEVGNLEWLSRTGEVVLQKVHPDHPGVLEGMHKYALARYNRSPWNIHNPPKVD